MLRLVARRGVAVAAARRRGLSAAAEALDSEPVGAPSPSSGPSARVAALADDLVRLNMLEVKELTDTLKERLGIDDSALAGAPAMTPAMMAAMAGVPAATSAAPAEEAVPEKTAFDLKLESFDAGKKIAIIKELRTITELGLKEAKALVDDAPKVFKTAVAKEEAEEIAHKLKELGAVVVLE